MPLRIAITPGEPAGIGPELAVKIAQNSQDVELVCIGSAELMQQRAKALGLDIALQAVDFDKPPQACAAGEMRILDVPLAAASQAGELNVQNADYVLNTLQVATDHCLAGDFAAVVTGPVQKSIINDSGIPFSGHTEFFAEKSHTKKVVMMLACEGLRVALATTHIPLRAVPDAITPELLTEVIHILNKDLQNKFGLKQPNILVCGLNPHAGEGGHLGMEEIETITPVLENLREQGLNLKGPLAADTLFTDKNLEGADAVLAMYHDQGLPVLKHKGFGNAVNITLGLPFIRTSVDHGTALHLAGKGVADASSLEEALKQACAMAQAAGKSA